MAASSLDGVGCRPGAGHPWTPRPWVCIWVFPGLRVVPGGSSHPISYQASSSTLRPTDLGSPWSRASVQRGLRVSIRQVSDLLSRGPGPGPGSPLPSPHSLLNRLVPEAAAGGPAGDLAQKPPAQSTRPSHTLSAAASGPHPRRLGTSEVVRALVRIQPRKPHLPLASRHKGLPVTSAPHPVCSLVFILT